MRFVQELTHLLHVQLACLLTVVDALVNCPSAPAAAKLCLSYSWHKCTLAGLCRCLSRELSCYLNYSVLVLLVSLVYIIVQSVEEHANV